MPKYILCNFKSNVNLSEIKFAETWHLKGHEAGIGICALQLGPPGTWESWVRTSTSDGKEQINLCVLALLGECGSKNQVRKGDQSLEIVAG